MTMSRRTLLRRGVSIAGSLAFADVLGLNRVVRTLAATNQQPPLNYLSQFDGTYCCCSNCSPASAAMLRSTQSNNLHNPSSASLRLWYNYQAYPLTAPCGPSSHPCYNASTGKGCPDTSGTCGSQYCPDAGTDPYYVWQALEHPRDSNDVYPTDWENTGLNWSYFTSLVEPSGGWSAIVLGAQEYNLHNCDPGSSGGHSIYVLKADSSGANFYVYDPDNWNHCSQPLWWSASDLQTFAYHYSGQNGTGRVYCIVGQP